MDNTAERRCDSYSAYRDGVREVLGYARRTIAIFDPDLRESGLERSDSIALLDAFCRKSTREDALRLLVCTTDHLERDCPRLVALLVRFRHRASVRVSTDVRCDELAPAAIVDGVHLVTRFHPDGPRGKICIDDAAAAAGPLKQFEIVWQGGECRSIGASLGI